MTWIRDHQGVKRGLHRRLRRRGAFCTWTWTRSTRRSSSGTGRSCEDGPSRLAAGRKARRGGRRQLRGARSSASVRRFRCPRAVRLCPDLVIVRPDFAKYKAASGRSSTSSVSVTPLVEPLSLDEAYLDVTENAWGEPLGMTRRAAAQDGHSRAATGLTASAGVAPNKFLAKIASGWQKPDGLTVIAPERVEHFLQRAGRRRAVGRRAGDRGAKLRAYGIDKLVDVRSADPGCCAPPSGRWPSGCSSSRTASTTARSCSEHEPKSSGSENTFAQRPHRTGRHAARGRRDGR